MRLGSLNGIGKDLDTSGRNFKQFALGYINGFSILQTITVAVTQAWLNQKLGSEFSVDIIDPLKAQLRLSSWPKT